MSRSRLSRYVVGTLAGFAAILVVSSAAPQAAPAGWTRVEHAALQGGAHAVYIGDVEPADDAGHPWLAVGYVVDTDGKREPSAWTSGDGVTWQRITMQPTGSPEARDGPLLVARRGDVAVALGNRFEGSLRTAAWTSTDPGTWTP